MPALNSRAAAHRLLVQLLSWRTTFPHAKISLFFDVQASPGTDTSKAVAFSDDFFIVDTFELEVYPSNNLISNTLNGVLAVAGVAITDVRQVAGMAGQKP